MLRKEYIQIESSTQHSSVNDIVVINIPEEDVEPKQITLDPDDQPIWESAKTVAPTPNSASMLKKCHGHGLTKGAIIQIFYHGLDKPTQGILDITAGGIFLYKSPNQAFQFLEDKVLFKLDWSTKSQQSVSFTDKSDSNTDNSRFMEKLKAMDSQIISLNKELQDIRNKYNELRQGNASKNYLNDDTLMCECHEVNYIQSEEYQNRNYHDSYSHQSYHDPNNSKKSLTELKNDVRNDLEDFKRRIRSMRTVHWKLYNSDNRKTTGVLPNKKSKPVNQEPQFKTDFEKLMTKFLDGQRVTNMFFKNNVNDMILKMKQNEKNFQTKIKNIERKLDEWSKSQNVFSKQTDRTNPPPPQAHTEHVNVVFTGSERSDYSPKTLKDPPPSIIINNKIKKDRPIKTSKGNYHVVKTEEYPFLEYIPIIPYPKRLSVDHTHLNLFKYVTHSAGVSRISISASKKKFIELCGCVRWKPSRDYNSSTRDTEGFNSVILKALLDDAVSELWCPPIESILRLSDLNPPRKNARRSMRDDSTHQAYFV
ncbi:hypothetical protein Tco_0930320 [Tanacetum coccineum]